jgi:hypothetical protein
MSFFSHKSISTLNMTKMIGDNMLRWGHLIPAEECLTEFCQFLFYVCQELIKPRARQFIEPIDLELN